MSSEGKKNLWYAIGAGVAIVGAAIIYSMMKGDDAGESGSSKVNLSVPEIDTDDLRKKLAKGELIPVGRDQNNAIDTQYFLKLLQFVGVSTREILKEQRDHMTAKRRKAYKKQNWDKYHKIVEDVIKLEDDAASKILKQVLDELELQEQDFAVRHMQLSQDPQYAEFVMAAQQGKLQQPKADAEVKMSKQETIKHLQKTAEVQLEQMKSIGSKVNMEQPPQSQDEQMKLMVTMMVEQCKAQDKIYIDSGENYENEEFEAALLHYCARDPEVAKHMQEYMMKMRNSMPQQ